MDTWYQDAAKWENCEKEDDKKLIKMPISAKRKPKVAFNDQHAQFLRKSQPGTKPMTLLTATNSWEIE